MNPELANVLALMRSDKQNDWSDEIKIIEEAVRPARVVVTLDGGIVQDVTTIDGTPAEVMVLDFDTDGADPEDLTKISEADGFAYVSWPTPGAQGPEDLSNVARLRQLFDGAE
jgi:hypothetical protein